MNARVASDSSAVETLIGVGPVRLDLEEGVGRLRLNRPEVSNAMDLPLMKALFEAVLQCGSDERIRAMLLTGEGSNFCAGGDVSEFVAQADRLPAYTHQTGTYLQLAVSALLHLHVPVIAAVQGWATGGGGFGLVCASDIVIAGESARFMLGATRVAMVPDAGLTVVLPRLVGLRRALDLALTNRVVHAAEALEIGLITKVVSDDALATESWSLARELANGPTRSLGATKQLLWSGLGSPVEAGLPPEIRAIYELSSTRDVAEGLAAVVERRQAIFQGR